MHHSKDIISKRLKIRRIEWNDLEHIHTLHSLPESDEFNTLGIPKDMDATKKVITPWIAENQSNSPKNYTFAVESNDNAEFLGLFGLKLGKPKFKSAEVWYIFHPNHWGKGYATEAVNAVLKFGFEKLKLHRIEAGCAVENIGSIKVLEKAGMFREGRKREILPLKSGWSDNFSFAILESDYFKNN
ncbi:MAG: GNAT family N-acetyltransferase [Bacteroidota bacterium]